LIHHIDTFHLLAEVAIAIAGFAGVASVFGGRDKQYRDAELLRIRGLFQLSALVLAGCFGVASFKAAGMSHEATVSLVSMILMVANGLVALDAPLKALKLYGRNGSTVTVASLVIVWSLYLVGVPLLAANLLFIRQEWPLILLFSLTVLVSIWSFYRLVTRVD
jgi:hypothetical protein